MANSKATKRALFSSAVSLLLCFTMLMGATFAWFTDNVSSTGNRIQAGTLEVDLVMDKLDGEGYVSIADSSGDIFSEDGNGINWEPGKTEIVYLGVRNNGSLALKYNILLNIVDGDPGLIGSLEYALLDGKTSAEKYENWEEVKAAANDQVGDVKAGQTVAAQGGVLDEIAYDASNTEETNYFALAVHMKEDAGNEYQGGSITIDVIVNATQKDAEFDSFGNDYDEDANIDLSPVSDVVVAYDTAKTSVENGRALQNAINGASEGDVILVTAGTYHFADRLNISQDDVTLMGENGTVLENTAAAKNGFINVIGDNVILRNLELNKNLTQTNQVILAYGADNLTVDGCEIYGVNSGNTPTMGIYFMDQLDNTDDEKNDPITKYTIINNTFNGAAVGMYKGGSAKVTTDPGVITASVSEDMVIENNTFNGASILIEGWRSWRTENTRDHEYVPTIKNNNFVTPNLCFDNTPHSIYLRCYRQGDPDQILPAGFIDAFVANNTVATPTNDTVVTYNGTDYVLSDDYGCFYRDNATYGIIAYCYGQNFEEVNN